MDKWLFGSLGFSICSLFFASFIMIMYLSKKRFKNFENTIFITLLIIVFGLIALEFTYVILLYNKVALNIASFFCRLWLNFVIIWLTVFTYYIIVLRTRIIDNVEVKNKTRKNIGILFTIVGILALIASNILPIEMYNFGERIYSFSGDATNICFVIAAISLSTTIYAFVIRKDLIDANQRKPLIFAIFIIFILTAVQIAFPDYDFNYQNFQFVLLLMSLFFTLENQDNKLLNEHQISKEEAEIANAKQTKFLSSMSHEIRTPMSVIMGYSDAILREKELTQDIVRSDVNYIHMAAINLLELINNILDLSRIESGKETIIEKEYDTQDLLVEVNELVLSKINKDKVRFEIIVDPNLPTKLSGDYTKVSKMLSNALLNVIYYTKQGGIILKTTFSNSGNGFVLINAITSENSEIDEDEFKLFYNVDSTEGIGVTSTGVVLGAVIGVNVAKMYAEMLNGKLYMTNKDRYNIGYTIEVEESVINPNPIGDISSLFEEKEEEQLNLEGKNILVVDDNMLNIKLLKRLLVDYKANVDSATSGAECLDKVKQNSYDVIFLDHMMPGMDGLETINKLRTIKDKVPPTIALTANSYSGVKEFYVNAGFSDYLAKPINKLELNKLLNNLFKN